MILFRLLAGVVVAVMLAALAVELWPAAREDARALCAAFRRWKKV